MAASGPTIGPAETAITRQGAVPVLRTADADRAYDMCARVIGAGLDVIELTATTPGWEGLLRSVVRDFPEATIGMGTITTADAAATACDAGARFLVSPYPADDARREAVAAGVLFVGGGFSPGEIAAASGHGLCKLFPAHLGEPAYVKTLTAILPGARIMPTGGIGLADIAGWLRAGAVAVGVGSELSAAPDLAEAAAEMARQVAAGRTP